MKKTDYSLIEELKDIFGAELVGTGLLYTSNLISKEPNNLDIVVDVKYIDPIRRLLFKYGFEELIKKREPLYKPLHTGNFSKENYIGIHLLTLEKKEGYKSPDILSTIADKIKRNKNDDLKVAFEALSKLLHKTDLAHYHDQTSGLYCIDKNPKEVDYEFILKNCFRI